MNDFALVCHRKVDDLGRIVIPKDVRKMLSINSGEPLNISVSDRGILITKRDTSDDFVDTLTKAINRLDTLDDMSRVQKDVITRYLEDAISAAKGETM